jgi:threonine dehydrogenase-like Zn-dependent dehydrogenase
VLRIAGAFHLTMLVRCRHRLAQAVRRLVGAQHLPTRVKYRQVRPIAHGLPTRRRFLRAAAVLSVPILLARRNWGQGSAPNFRLNLAVIGIGKMGRLLLNNGVQRDDAQVIAVCDVDTTRREVARQHVNEAYSKKADASWRGCAAYNDFRDVIGRRDINAVVIAVPDHWHAMMAIAAVKAGKDVNCEKPLTHTIDEALRLVQAVRQTNRVLQTGSQQRSSKEFRVAARAGAKWGNRPRQFDSRIVRRPGGTVSFVAVLNASRDNPQVTP